MGCYDLSEERPRIWVLIVRPLGDGVFCQLAMQSD
jgi:hypothetical protein